MAYAGARFLAAAFQSVGIEATITDASDTETLELGGLYSSGEECLPHKITLGDFIKVCRSPGFDPTRTAFLMATAHGPCRFGQYAPYLKQVLNDLGYGEVMVFSPASKDGYESIAEDAEDIEVFKYTIWIAVILGDMALKFLLKTRPYEINAGDSDAAFEESINEIEVLMARPGMKPRHKLREAVVMVGQMRDRFRSISARYQKGRPLIGVVGEIYCRHNTFSNEDVVRRIEKVGGECWMADIAEWIWYANWHQQTETLKDNSRFSWPYLQYKLKTHVQHKYEQALYAPVVDDLKGYEEPHDVRQVLAAAEPYLPSRGCLGEMALSVGKTVYLHGKGADGIIDISPFTCMNGIICEAVYPALSADFDDLPIRMCYFDGVDTDIDRDLEIFLELARAYQGRKPHPRIYPDYYE
jgi:predicted nucleotide-binding protein (sugar kinase/HSP70/actin superfamily)